MSSVVAFPRPVNAIGTMLSMATIQEGIEEAERRGIPQQDLATVTRTSRRLTLYFLGLLGSEQSADRGCGEVGLRRLIAADAAEARA